MDWWPCRKKNIILMVPGISILTATCIEDRIAENAIRLSVDIADVVSDLVMAVKELEFLAHRIRITEILPWDRKSYLSHAILPRRSSNVIM